MTTNDGSILLVDDEPDLLATTKSILERAGFNVHAFESPLEALYHIKGGCHSCTLLLTDVRMPSMTGLELLIHVKKLRPDIRIVVMTGYNIDHNDLQEITPSAKIDGYVNKPFNSEKLLEVLNQVIGRSNV